MKTRKAWHQLDVTEVDNLRFRCASESGNAPYFVDLAEHGGAGGCSCADFQCRIAPVLAGKKEPPKDKPDWMPSCKHLLRVKIYVADRFVAELLKQPGYHHDGP